MKRLIVAGMVAMMGATTYATATGASAVAAAAHTAAAHSAGADHIGPSKIAWYDASRATAAAPPAPMAGVGPKDLVVEGLTINTALLPISLPIPPIHQVTAFVALSFKLPKDATPASLSLRLTGSSTTAIAKHLPSGVTPIACPATSAFKSGLQQPIGAAPKYDCSKRSTVGQLNSTGKAVTFPGISRLLKGNTLSVVILPGSLGVERLVFSHPNARTLGLLSFPSAPPIATPSVPPVPTPTTAPPVHGGSGVDIPAIPPAPAITAPDTSASPPAIAPSATPGLAAVALSKPDDTRDRTAAFGLLVALLVGVTWLTVTDRGGRTATAEFGVGRFRSQRSGPPPTI